ncbi:TAXI family TRAP transporter solute-binding subunit [Orrella daihaiensis]|uniref:TAXI family TRAP transporter solute-binding subunit n=1 Tax=Orrella daihaiensis TaxID=2782176 RepID=A0ABY4AQU1_9BURK|nr:TAXI family TRAP transporter solute-binding subunit [Orrella daihaiensis]UOD50419.1 TAXI family TRAP transporter solute-binding subunit [Orrella daihaiensis]
MKLFERKLFKQQAAPLLAAFGVACALTLGGTDAQAQSKQLSIGATSQASSLYAYHVAVAQLLNEKLPGVNITVVETGGGLDNMRRLSQGQVDWGMMAEPDLFEYYKGLGPFEGKPNPNFRTFWLTTALAYFPVVGADSGINSIADLNGKQFNGGGRGSGTERATVEAFDALGIKPDWFRTGMGDAVTAFKDRRIVGFTKAGPPASPDSAILDAQTARPIKILNWTDAEMAKVKQAYPHFDFMAVPDTPYKTGPMNLRVVFITMGTTTDMSEQQAYDIFKTIVNNVDTVAQSYPAVKGLDIAKQTIERAQTPLHPGVVRYFRENGVAVPDRLIPPEMK